MRALPVACSGESYSRRGADAWVPGPAELSAG